MRPSLHRIARIAAVAIGTAALTLAPLCARAQDFSKVEIQTQKLTPNLYMLIGAGGNIGVSIGEDAVFVIDDQYAPLTPKILAAIAKLTPKPVKFLINTHWHGDHAGGNENFGNAGAIIFAHENVRKRMSTDQFIELFNMKSPASPAIALPVVTFTRDIAFHLNGDDIVAFHAPNAHTDGDSIVQFRNSNVIHMGDTMFNKMYPFIDSATGGSPDGVVAAADRVLAMTDDKTMLIPGHGPLANKADLQAFRVMLATVTQRVRDAIKAGKKLEEVVAAKPTADFDAVWGKGFLGPDKFVETIYRGMAK